MINPQQILIDALVAKMERSYTRMYGDYEAGYSAIIGWAAHMALENIANSDALYHDVEHTVMVTQVGQELLKGKHAKEGGVTPKDWLHFSISLLCHDIGYVRGVCLDDKEGKYATGISGETISVPPGSTDASMTPYHIERGKLFIRERFKGHKLIDAELIAKNIENTRFPVPKDEDHQGTSDFTGLVRAADLIGQLADPNYLRKLPALYHEFEETGANVKLGYKHPGDLQNGYAKFYWNVVIPYVKDGLRYLSITQEGKQWIANLQSHVFAIEHGLNERF
jgi:hypothetical protein